MVAARRPELGRPGRSVDAGSRRHRPVQRPPGLRVDLEPDRQHRRAAGWDRPRHQPREPVPIHAQHRPPTSRPTSSPEPRGAVFAERDRSRLQVPAGVAKQRRGRSQAAGRVRQHHGVSLRQGRQRHLLHQRQPARGPVGVRWRRQPAALGRHAMRGSRQSGRLRHPHQQRARQRRRRQLRAAERRRGQLVELRPVAVEDHRVRPVGPRRLQLRHVEVDLRPGIHRGHQLRPQQPRGDPNNPGSSISLWSPGHRVFALVNYTRSYFNFGARRCRCSSRRATAPTARRRD